MTEPAPAPQPRVSALAASYPDADAVPAALQGPDGSLAGLRVLVTGLGVSGFPIAAHLAEREAEVTVVDGNTDRDESERIRIL